MYKRLLVLAVFMISLLGAIAMMQETAASADKASAKSGWEYGAYRERKGLYEWQDDKTYVSAVSQPAFLEQLGIPTLVADMEKRYQYKPLPFSDEVVHTAFLNYLGKRGWELVEITEGELWFKRPR